MKNSTILLSLATGLLAFCGMAMAQDEDGHGLMTVRTSNVKVGKEQEFRELLGKLAAARKAAGHSGVTTWEVVRGPASTYYTVTPADSYADFGQPFDSGMSDGDWQRWVARITELVASSNLTTLRTHRDLAIAATSDSAPNLVMLRYSTLKPGNAEAHHEWLEKSLVPALKAGGSNGWNVSDVRMGDNTNTWISSTRIDSWAQLDGPGPLTHLSDRARRNLLEDYNERLESSRVEVIRFVPELSY